MRRTLWISLAFVTLTGCSIGEASPRVSTDTPVVAPSFTPIATLTAGPVTAPTLPAATISAASPTAAATFEPFTALTSADNLALRKGPGHLFTRIGLLGNGTPVRVMARSRGGEWAMAETDDGRVGWIFVQLLAIGDYDWGLVPYSEPLAAKLITGLVKDAAGVPISGIQFAFTQGSGSLAPRTDAMTDETGTFYAYFPESTSGRWYVSYTAIACTSNTMDSACNPRNGIGGKPYPESQYITLPLNSQIALEFVWK